MTTLAKGPCKCGYGNDDIVLTGESWQARDGGTYWRVGEFQYCDGCDTLLTVFYEAPIILEMPARVKRAEYITIK